MSSKVASTGESLFRGTRRETTEKRTKKWAKEKVQGNGGK